MTTSYRQQSVLRTDSVESPQDSYSSIAVTITDTMKNGSLLINNLEATSSDSTLVDGVINDPKLDEGFYKVGTTQLLSVCKRKAIINASVIKFSDKAYENEALTTLENNLVRVQSAVSTFNNSY